MGWGRLWAARGCSKMVFKKVKKVQKNHLRAPKKAPTHLHGFLFFFSSPPELALAQAQQVVEQETRFIAMIEGGIQAQEMLLKKIEPESQPTNIEGQDQESKPKSSQTKGQPA